MDTIIKIDYKAFCKGIIDDIETIYNVKAENLPLHLPTILKWVEKIQDDYLIKKLEEDDLTTVIKLMEAK